MSERFKFGAVGLVCLVGIQATVSFVAFFLHWRGFGLAAFSDFMQCALLLFATLACLLNVQKTNQRARLFWSLMGLGLGSWLIYRMLWTYIEVVQRHEVPDPFTADAILFLHFVPMMAALALQPDIRQDGIAQSIQAITALRAAGYTRFLVYDNFGNYLETVGHDAAERFSDLNRYLLSHAIFGHRDIHYLDVCAFGAQDEDLAVQLRDYHRRQLDERIRQAGLQV